MGFLHNTAAQGTDQFFQYKDYDNINRAAPSGPGGGGYETYPNGGTATNNNLNNVVIAPISDGLFILTVLCLGYLLVRRKKSLSVLLLTAPFIFTQCNPDNNEGDEDYNEIKSIYVKGYAYANANDSRSNITNDNGTGKINWDDNETIYCYPVNTHNIFTPFTNSDNTDKNEFNVEGTIISDADCYIRFYKIGESKVDIINSYTIQASGLVVPTQTNISLDFSKQSGKIEDFGKYHISKSNDAQVKYVTGSRPPAHTFTTATFTSMIAYACFDLSKYEGKNVVISVDNGDFHNHFTLVGKPVGDNSDPDESFSQVEGTNGEITITNPSSETYVVLAPLETESPVVNFSVDGVKVGSVTFPNNGIVANNMYTGNNGSPIKLGAKAIIY